MPKVSILRGEPDVKKALELIEFSPQSCELVVIKPNLASPLPSSTGATNDLRVLKQLFELYTSVASEIVLAESDGTAASAEQILDAIGAGELLSAYNVSFVNLGKDDLVPVKGEFNALRDARVPKTILKADVLVNVATMGVHPATTVSLSLKNMLGVLPGRKFAYHPHLSDLICDVIRIRKPDLNIIDGIVGTEAGGRAKKMDLILASHDPVALDTIACKIMGVNPINVEHLVKAGYLGFGEYAMNRIQVLGEAIENVRDRFEL